MLWLLGKMRMKSFHKYFKFPLNSDIYFAHNSVYVLLAEFCLLLFFIKGKNKNCVSTED